MDSIQLIDLFITLFSFIVLLHAYSLEMANAKPVIKLHFLQDLLETDFLKPLYEAS